LKKVVKYDDTVAIILCGGLSSRMGTHKAILDYHGTPQYQYLTALCNGLFAEVIISANNDQDGLFDETYNVIYDKLSCGPMSGLKSCIEVSRDRNYFLLGCDYPDLGFDDIIMIMENKNRADIICYHNQENLEPLIALYNKKVFSDLLSFSSHSQSLNKFIRSNNYLSISPNDLKNIRSIDNNEDYIIYSKIDK
jgi:molybdopterin-guanine dinucleotide biosynthesis protein A